MFAQNLNYTALGAATMRGATMAGDVAAERQLNVIERLLRGTGQGASSGRRCVRGENAALFEKYSRRNTR